MSLKGIVLSLLAAGTIGAAFVGIDYSASKDMDRNSLRLRARVGQESIAYKKFGFGTDYTTEGEGLTGKIGVNVRKAMNFGNRDVAYVVEPQELRYMTQGSIFFEPKEVVSDIPGGMSFAIVSSADVADVGDLVEFEPKYRERFLERLIGKQAKNLFINSGEHKGAYEKPLVNPRGLIKIE